MNVHGVGAARGALRRCDPAGAVVGPRHIGDGVLVGDASQEGASEVVGAVDVVDRAIVRTDLDAIDSVIEDIHIAQTARFRMAVQEDRRVNRHDLSARQRLPSRLIHAPSRDELLRRLDLWLVLTALRVCCDATARHQRRNGRSPRCLSKAPRGRRRHGCSVHNCPPFKLSSAPLDSERVTPASNHQF